MGRLFGWGGSTSVSTAGTFETTWKSRSLQELMILSDSQASAADPDYALSKLGMCGGLSQSALSSQRDSSLMVTFCRKSRPIINGRLFWVFPRLRALVFVSSVNFVRDWFCHQYGQFYCMKPGARRRRAFCNRSVFSSTFAGEICRGGRPFQELLNQIYRIRSSVRRTKPCRFI